MRLADKVQQELFSTITKVEKNKQWKSSLAAELNWGRSTMYKKINGDIKLSLDEFFHLCEKYQLDYNHLTRPMGQDVSFQVPFLGEKRVDGSVYLDYLIRDLRQADALTDPKLYISALEIPLVYDYNFVEIPAFKNYMNGISNWYTDLHKIEKFSLSRHLPSTERQEQYATAIEQYCELHTIEFWNPHQLTITLQQIQYCMQGGLYAQPEDALAILDALTCFANYIEDMALHGRKFRYREGKKPFYKAQVEMYYNEIAHSNSFALLDSVEKQIAFITLDTPNYMVSTDEKLTSYVKVWAQKLQQTSLPVSGRAHRNRLEFVHGLHAKIDRQRRKVGEWLLELRK